MVFSWIACTSPINQSALEHRQCWLFVVISVPIIFGFAGYYPRFFRRFDRHILNGCVSLLHRAMRHQVCQKAQSLV